MNKRPLDSHDKKEHDKGCGYQFNINRRIRELGNQGEDSIGLPPNVINGLVEQGAGDDYDGYDIPPTDDDTDDPDALWLM